MWISILPLMSRLTVRMSMLARLLCVIMLVLNCLPHRVDHALNCVKGGGACHLREKVLAEAAKTFDSSSKALLECSSILFRFILVADYRKNVQYLGTNVGPCKITLLAEYFPSLLFCSLHRACRSKLFLLLMQRFCKICTISSGRQKRHCGWQ
jgi:hypothetical protein